MSCRVVLERSAVALAMVWAAQGAGAQEPREANPDESTGLEEIVVTAQKRAESIQLVPISISALSAKQLEAQRVSRAVDIVSHIPNMTVSYSDTAAFFSLRGVSTVDYSANQSAPVAIYVDEVYKGLQAFSTSFQLFDIDRVEVLRGPQGTLFGKNATGGAMSVFSVQPDLSAGLSGHLEAGVGNFARRESSGALNIPMVTGVLAGRIAYRAARADGVVENRFPGQHDLESTDDWAVRGSLEYQPADDLNMLLRYTHTDASPTGPAFLPEEIGNFDPTTGIGFIPGNDRKGLGFYQSDANRTGRYRAESDAASLTVTWDLSTLATLTSVSALDSARVLAEDDFDTTPLEIYSTVARTDAQALSQDLRLASAGDGPFTWLAGAYYYRDSGDFFSDFMLYYGFPSYVVPGCVSGAATNGCGYSTDYSQIRHSYALYTQDSYRFSNGVTLSAGVRYTQDEIDLPHFFSQLRALDPQTGQEVTVGTVFANPPLDHSENDNVSGKIGVSYEAANGGLFLYANASRGYRGAAFNGSALFSADEVTLVPPERLDAYEIGAKTQSADNRLRVNGALFYYDYKSQQFLDFNGYLQILTSAPQSHLSGGEIELVAQPAKALGIRLGASYLQSQFDELTLGPRKQNLAGKRLPLAPVSTLTGGIDWEIVRGGFGGLTLHTDSRYTSRMYFDAFNRAEISQGSTLLHDARLVYETPDRAWSFSAWVRNATGVEYRVFKIRLAANLNDNVAIRGRPREFGLEARFRF